MRRVHLPALRPGDLAADPQQSHHLRSVLRLTTGETVEAFDAVGHTAVATVVGLEPVVLLRIETVEKMAAGLTLTVAAAVPKGDRADWMIEKLSEVGVARFVPLRTARSVVHPEGRSKIERWQRIAVESAKQCRRPGVMTIDPLTDLRILLPTIAKGDGLFCSTDPDAPRLQSRIGHRESHVLLIGPEGDWSDDETAAFTAGGLTPVSLGPTILRVETAAVLAAGFAMLLTPVPK